MTFRELFEGMAAAGMSREQALGAAQSMGIEMSPGMLDAEIPAQPEAAPPTTIRALSPGRPVVAGVTQQGLVPVESITFDESEAALPGMPTEPPSEPVFSDPIPAAPAPARKATQPTRPAERYRIAESTNMPGGVVRSVGEAGKLALRELTSGLTGSALADPSLEMALAQGRGELTPPDKPETKPEVDPDLLSRAIARTLKSGQRLSISNVAKAGVAEAIESPVHYTADLLGTTAGVAVGATEPVAAGLLGVGAALGIPGIEEAYDASVTRMERTMLDLSNFYEGKLSETLAKNIRSNASEIPSAIFHIIEGLAGGALTAEELEATNAIDRATAGFKLGREMGAQMTEGTIAAFAMLASNPPRAAFADPIGTFMTIAPVMHAIRSGKMSIDASRLPSGTLAVIDKTADLYEAMVDDLVKNQSFNAEAITAAKRLHAKVDRTLSREGSSVERLEQDFFDAAYREPESQRSATRSAGEQLGREVRRGVESDWPETGWVDDPVVSREAMAGTPGPDVRSIFRPDEPVSDRSPIVEREFEVFKAKPDPETGLVELSPTESRSALVKSLTEKYERSGMSPKRAASRARKESREMASRGVQSLKRVDLRASRDRLLSSLGRDGRRIIEELGGAGLIRKGDDGPTSGLVDIDSDEFLVAMAEAVDAEVPNILASAKLRRLVSSSITKKIEEAQGFPASRSQKESVSKLVHSAASRLPPERGLLGSPKTYDIDIDLPNGESVSLLGVARSIIAGDKAIAGRVFEESILSATERLAHTVKQRRTQRGWLDAFGGRESLKRGRRPSAADEASLLASNWIESSRAGEPPSLPPGFMNDPVKIHAELQKLPRDVQSSLPPAFWARFMGQPGTSPGPIRRGRYKPMSVEMMQHVGLVDAPDPVGGVRKVQIKAPFNSEKQVTPLWIPEHVHSFLEMQIGSDKWMKNPSIGGRLFRLVKTNTVARNASSLFNALQGNVLYQMVRRGDPTIPAKMLRTVGRYRDWKNGKVSDPKEARMFESIDRTGVIGSNFVESELNQVFGTSNRSMFKGALSKSEAGRLINDMVGKHEDAFAWTDSGAKLEDAVHNYKQLDKYMGMIKKGEWLQGSIGPNKAVRIYKGDGGRWRMDSPDGRVLSDAQLSMIQARMAVRPGLAAFFDYGDVGRMARALRGGSKAGAFAVTFMNPYWTWQNKAMTIPGIQRGLAGHAMTDGVPVLTNNKAVRLDQANSHALVGFRRAALVQGARNTLGDREFHETLRDSSQYASSQFEKAVATFNRMADPNYIAVKQWGNASFLQPFDNMMGVIDALISSPDQPGAKAIKSISRKNKDVRDADTDYSGYDDMTMLFGSLDPNNEHDLQSVFPVIAPSERGRASTTMDAAFAGADGLTLKAVPAENLNEVKRIRNIWRDAWSGKTSLIASASSLAGMTGGIMERALSAWKAFSEKDISGDEAWQRVTDQIGPMIMGGTTYKVGEKVIAPALLGDPLSGGIHWRYLPKDASVRDALDIMWAAVTGMGKLHIRAVGKPNSSLGERRGILDRDISNIKRKMRKSFSDTLGKDIIRMNQQIDSYMSSAGNDAEAVVSDPRVGISDMSRSDFDELVSQRDNALHHWHKIMGSSAPGEMKSSKGGLINEIANKYERYILDGWSRTPTDILTPGTRRKGVPAHTTYNLF